MGMSAIRWEQDVIDGVSVDVWGGWMGRQNVCEVRMLREGVWCLRRYCAYPGSGDRDNWCTNFERFDIAKRIAEEWVDAWLELYGLQARHAEELASVRNADTGIAVCEVVPYVGTLGHLFGGRDMRFLIDPESLPIGAKLYLQTAESGGEAA